MTGILRSKQGCWTCRLRKKKCDEGRPQCSSCDALQITCHGYGPKPLWMDNGERERAMVDDFKRKIRMAARHKRQRSPAMRPPSRQQQAPLPPQQPQPVVIAMRSEAVEPILMGHCDNLDNSHGCRASNRASIGLISLSSATSDASAARFQQSPASSPATGISSEGGRPIRLVQDSDSFSTRKCAIAPITARDSMLLMHFLDQVIPAQYPLYRPQPLDGGRGWLLSLLLRSKSLYHGALALSSYHRLISILAGARPACRALAATRHEHHLESCLRAVRCTMQEMTRANANFLDFDAGTLISVIQLVFSEALTGESDAWRMHLRGAIEMYRCAMTGGTRHAKQTEEALAILRSSMPSEGEAADLCEDVSSMRFMSSAVLWLDIVGSVTEGAEPRLLSMHDQDLGTGSGIRLEEVMGCQNQVMVQLARIAALQATWKSVEVSANGYEVADIQNALHRAHRDSLALMQEEHAPQRRICRTIAIVSIMFCHAAGVYLHLITNGFRDDHTLQQLTADAMPFLRTEVTAELTTGLVCPLFIIGCAATTTDEQALFRTTFSSHEFLNPLFKHRPRLLPILEEIWRERWKNDAYSWNNVVRLSRDILLV
ncbi:hypothetical protein E4U58_005927 [Claviceps cyperi]|nr:hypothetical protein E4U58_005927 [Claviceps cyperi]